MGVFAVKDIEEDEETSLRGLLDKQVSSNVMTYKNLFKQANPQSSLRLSARRDISLLEMLDENELYGFLSQNYGCRLSQKDFLRKLRALDRDGSGRLRAKELLGMLRELVTLSATSYGRQNPSRAGAAPAERRLSSAHAATATTTAGAGRIARHHQRARPGSRAERLAREFAESSGAEVVDSSPLPVRPLRTNRRGASGAVHLLYSTQEPMIERRLGPRPRPAHDPPPETAPPSPEPAVESPPRSPGGTMQDRFTDRSTPNGVHYPTAAIMSGVYNYGPRATTPLDTSHDRHRQREIRYPSRSPKGGGKDPFDVYRDPKDLIHDSEIVKQQVFLNAHNHSRPGTSEGPPSPGATRQSSHRPHTSPAGSGFPPIPELSGQTLDQWWPTGGGHRARGSRVPSTAPTGGSRYVSRGAHSSDAGQSTAHASQKAAAIAQARPMSRYKYRQAESFVRRDYSPSVGEQRLGWMPRSALKSSTAMMAGIRVKEKPTANNINIRVNAMMQIRQAEARHLARNGTSALAAQHIVDDC